MLTFNYGSPYLWDKFVLTKFISGCHMVWDLICGTSRFYKSKTEKVIGGGMSAILPNWCCLLSITACSLHSRAVVSKYAKIVPKDGACCPNFQWRFWLLNVPFRSHYAVKISPSIPFLEKKKNHVLFFFVRIHNTCPYEWQFREIQSNLSEKCNWMKEA